MFFRYVSLGAIADGSLVYWDTKEHRGVKLAHDHWKRRSRVEERKAAADGRADATPKPGTRHGSRNRTAYGPEAGVPMLMLAIGFVPMTMLVCSEFLKPRRYYSRHSWFPAMIGQIGGSSLAPRIVAAACAILYGTLLCWIWWRMCFGSPRDLEPATAREVASALSRRGEYSYRRGVWPLFLPFMVMIWSVPANALCRPFLGTLPGWRGSLPDRLLWWSLAAWVVYPVMAAVWLRVGAWRRKRRRMRADAERSAGERSMGTPDAGHGTGERS